MSFERRTIVAHSYTNLLYHIVFATLERSRLISGEFPCRLHEYLGGIVRGLGGISLGVNGAEDHIHMLAKLHQDLAVSEFVEKVKSNSSGWAENVLPGGFAWQRGYSAFTVSESQVEKVRRYIANQQIRHKRVTFEEELRTLL